MTPLPQHFHQISSPSYPNYQLPHHFFFKKLWHVSSHYCIIVIIITHLCGCHCHYCHNKSDCDAISMILLVRSDDGMSVRLCMVTLTASSDYSPILGIECSSYWIYNENLENQPSSINWFKIIQIQNHLQQLGKLIVLSFLTRKCYE